MNLNWIYRCKYASRIWNRQLVLLSLNSYLAETWNTVQLKYYFICPGPGFWGFSCSELSNIRARNPLVIFIIFSMDTNWAWTGIRISNHLEEPFRAQNGALAFSTMDPEHIIMDRLKVLNFHPSEHSKINLRTLN